MAQLMSVKLSRYDNSPWGFRLQGGKDFGTPLIIQKVNGGSPAEKAGLQAGDAVIRINNIDATALRHKDAQDCIVRAGNQFELAVQRGGMSTWKPQVTPVGPSPVQKQQVSGGVTPVTKTSLTYKGPAPTPIGTGHNVSAKPFGTIAHMNGGTDKAIVNKQYNSPVGIYSEEAIAETLSAQAEVLSGGAIGVNFKKNEKSYNAANSEVLKMVQEADKEPRQEPDPQVSPVAGGVPTPFGVHGLRHVTAPEPKAPVSPSNQVPQDPFKVLPPGQNICADCERLIVGVFVRIKDKNLHVECFKCATCGSSLKNVGYYNINNKLYCDIHAKMVARQNPPAPNLEPVTVPPGARAPAGTISSALAGIGVTTGTPLGGTPLSPGGLSPQPSTVGPLPFHPPDTTSSPTIKPVRAPTSHVVEQADAQMQQQQVQQQQMQQLQQQQHIQQFQQLQEAQQVVQQTQQIVQHHESSVQNLVSEMSSLAVSGQNPRPISPPSVYDIEHKAPRVGTSHVSAPKPQTPTSVSGPRPFGSPVSAPPVPTSTLGRSAPEMVREALDRDEYPICYQCSLEITRGPFITALGKIWCPHHFVCANSKCQRPLQDIGFVEEKGQLYCEYCFEQFIAPPCDKCSQKIKGDCLNAIGKHFHPECFNCAYCGKLFGNSPFFLEDGLPYCENDWNELFTTKCFACGFPIEAGDRWVEALSNNYHSQCFNCTMCKKNLEGQSFYAKGGRPFCKNHAR